MFTEAKLMQNLKIALTSIAMIALALVLVGCGGDDSPTAPQGDTLTVDSAMAEEITLQALDVVNNMVTEIPDIASGSPGVAIGHMGCALNMAGKNVSN